MNGTYWRTGSISRVGCLVGTDGPGGTGVGRNAGLLTRGF